MNKKSSIQRAFMLLCKSIGSALLLVIGLVIAHGSDTSVLAQTPAEGQPARTEVIIERKEIRSGAGSEGTSGQMPSGNYTYNFVSSEMSFDGHVVKGSPYSAESVTEIVQTLADGNRIVRKNTAMVYRDGEGRTRRDQSIGMIGPYATSGDAQRTIFINDPVANTNYVLDPKNHQAHNLPLLWKSEPLSTEMRRRSGAVKTFVVTSGAAESGSIRFSADSNSGINEKKESLGKQNIEGVEAEGTRVTTTIPAGKIGNERPIDIVSERWYSPELQAVVLSKRTDPMVGETTFRLTNVTRTEPAHSLFEVPSDYKIDEFPRERKLLMEKLNKDN